MRVLAPVTGSQPDIVKEARVIPQSGLLLSVFPEPTLQEKNSWRPRLIVLLYCKGGVDHGAVLHL